MITKRPAEARGRAAHGWLESFHTFSFADYHDPDWMGVGPLRVVNQDRVAPERGFATHGHRNMEIISYVLDGTLVHEDDMGQRTTMGAGEVQVMSAGRGVRHSEFNGSTTEPLEFLQMWIEPLHRDRTPSYQQRRVDMRGTDTMALLVSPDGHDDSLAIDNDVSLFGAALGPGVTIRHPLAAGRRGWLHVARGGLHVNGARYGSGDGAAITDETEITLAADEPSEVVLFDLP